MKTFIFSLLVCSALSTQATIRTVNNNPAGLAQYNDIQSAVDASATGDTVYVHGSVSTYGNVNITDKKIALIGPGISPDKNGPLLTAKVSIIEIANISTSNSNGSLVMGMHIASMLRISNNGTGTPVNGVKVIRNKFTNTNTSLTLYTGNPSGVNHMFDLLVEGNYFEDSKIVSGTSSYLFTNCTFVNNVFTVAYNSGCIESLNNCTNVVFDHNLFYSQDISGNGGTPFGRIFSGSASGGFSMKNNVLVSMNTINTHPNGSYTVSNVFFQNNITFNCNNNTPWALGSNINGGGNITNQDPQIVSQAAVNAGIFNPVFDFRILSGPANNAGTDGKDLGLLYDETTTMNWAYGRNSRLPYVHSLNVLNSNVPAGGNLNVQVNARKAK